MKTFPNPISNLLFLPVLASLLAGCAASRPISDIALGAGGAVVANKLSNGNVAITAAGAAGGVLVSEGIYYASNKQSQKAFQNGYDKGKSDAVKQQYWLYVGMQQEHNRVDHVRLYEVQLPEQVIDGVIFKPTTKNLRIEE